MAFSQLDPAMQTRVVCHAEKPSVQIGPSLRSEALEFATLEWVDWSNHKRLLAPIGNIPSAEAEQRYYATLDEQPTAV